MYERIGYGYDATRRAQPYIAQPYIAEQIARHLSLEEGRTYPDVACGTGNYSGALAAQGGSWAGVDLALRMIGQARQKTLAVHWDLDKAENSPSCAAPLRAPSAFLPCIISPFAGLASSGEVQEGCARLALDMESGRISGIIDEYRDLSGDYMFIAARKNG